MVMTVALPALTGRAVQVISEGAQHVQRHQLAQRCRRPRNVADAGARDPGRGARALGAHLLAAPDRRTCLARRRIRPARAALPAPAAARAGVFRSPADRSADVARHRRPAGRALLPRLRAGIHPAVDPDDRARRRCDDRDRTPSRPDLAVPGAVCGADLIPLRPAHASGDPGGAAAHRRAHGRRRGEHLGRTRRQGVRARAAPAAALSPQRRPRVRAGDGGHAPGSHLQPGDRVPAAARPRGGPVAGRRERDPLQPFPRPVHGVLPVPEHADHADALARRDAQPRPACDRVGRAPVPGARPGAAPDCAARRSTATARQRARAAA